MAAFLWQLLGDGSLVLAATLGQVLPGYFVATNRFLGLCRSVLVCLFGDSLALAVPLWQLLVGGSLALAALLRQVALGGLLTSVVLPGWLIGVGFFLPGILPLGWASAWHCSFASSMSRARRLSSPIVGLWRHSEALVLAYASVLADNAPPLVVFGAWCDVVQVHPSSA